MLLWFNMEERKIVIYFLVTLLAGHSFEKNFIIKAVVIFTLNTLNLLLAICCLKYSYSHMRIFSSFFINIIIISLHKYSDKFPQTLNL